MTGVIIFNIIFAFLLIVIISTQVLLRRGMNQSLYQYRNVSYIAIMIFASVLMLSLYFYLLSCLVETKEPTFRYIINEFIDFPRRFSLFALPVFGIICFLICISNVSLIRHEGLRLKNILGVLLSFIFIGGTLVIYLINYVIKHHIIDENGLGNNVLLITVHTYLTLFLLLVVCYLECFFIGTVIMAYLAAIEKPNYDKEFIIILGCSIDSKGGLLPLLKGRTNRAIRFAWEQEIATGKAVHFIPSGGKGEDEVMSEGSAMELYLLSHGAESDEVFPEKESRNTYENFLFSKRIIDDINPDGRVCFTTTNYHMFRSGILARMAGINAQGISSKTKWYFWPNGFVREYIALMVMKKKGHALLILILFVLCLIMAIISFAFGV